MKKKILLVIMALLSITSHALALDNNVETSRQRQESEREIKRNKEYPYKSSSGTRYKYDLSKPGDRIRYEVDPLVLK